jgi:hypothetical protein
MANPFNLIVIGHRILKEEKSRREEKGLAGKKNSLHVVQVCIYKNTVQKQQMSKYAE